MKLTDHFKLNKLDFPYSYPEDSDGLQEWIDLNDEILEEQFGKSPSVDNYKFKFDRFAEREYRNYGQNLKQGLFIRFNEGGTWYLVDTGEPTPIYQHYTPDFYIKVKGYIVSGKMNEGIVLQKQYGQLALNRPHKMTYDEYILKKVKK